MKPEISKAIGIFLAVAGLIGTVAQLLTSPSSLSAASFLILFVTLLLLGGWIIFQSMWQKLKTGRALPQIKNLDDISTRYQIVQATAEEIDWIAQLQTQVYSSADAVPKHVLMEWYKSNPTGFSIIKMQNGQKVGHIDLLPLRPSTFQTFLEGNIVERDIRGDSLFSQNEKHLIKDLYVESIIVLPPKGYSNAPAILSVLTNFKSLVSRISNTANIENVYAIAASKSGERLLRKLGFDIIKPSQSRKDKHDVFSAKFAELVSNITTICGARLPESPDLSISNETKNGDLA